MQTKETNSNTPKNCQLFQMILLFNTVILFLEHCNANQTSGDKEGWMTNYSIVEDANSNISKIKQDRDTSHREIINCLGNITINILDCIEESHPEIYTKKTIPYSKNLTIGQSKPNKSLLNCLNDIYSTPDNPQKITWRKMMTKNYLRTILIYSFRDKVSSIHPQYKGRVELNDSLPYVLQIKNSSLSDEGLYECTIIHENLSDQKRTMSTFTNSMELIVPHRPTAVAISISNSILKGHTVSMTEDDIVTPICTVYNGIPSPTIRWTLDNEPVRGTISNRFYAPIHRNLSEADTPRKKINTMHETRITRDMEGAMLTCEVTQADSPTHTLDPLIERRSYIISVLNKTEGRRATQKPETFTLLNIHKGEPRLKKQILREHLNQNENTTLNDSWMKRNNIQSKKQEILGTTVWTSGKSMTIEGKLTQAITLINNALIKIIIVIVTFAVLSVVILLLNEFYCRNRMRNNYNWRGPSLTSDEESWNETRTRTDMPQPCEHYNWPQLNDISESYIQHNKQPQLSDGGNDIELANTAVTDNTDTGEYEEMTFGHLETILDRPPSQLESDHYG